MFEKFLKKSGWTDIIISTVFILFGAMMIARPDSIVTFIAIFLGLIFVLLGVMKLYRYYSNGQADSYILAISIAKDSFYDAIRNGEKTRKIDCKYYILKTPLRLDNYKEEILPVGIRKIVIEKASSYSWNKLVFNDKYILSVDEFGDSGSVDELDHKYGFDMETVEEKIENLLK